MENLLQANLDALEAAYELNPCERIEQRIEYQEKDLANFLANFWQTQTQINTNKRTHFRKLCSIFKRNKKSRNP